MDIINIIILCTFLVLGLGIIYVLQKGFNEVIKGMESLDQKIKRIEDKLNKDSN